VDSDNDTIATSNQVGREEADAAKSDPDADSDVSLKRHDLQEDSSDMSSKIHDLEEDILLKEHASAAIGYLPNFAFYTRNQVLMPASEIKTLDFEDAFEHHMLKPMMFQEAYSHKDPEQCAKWHATIQKEFKDMNNC